MTTYLFAIGAALVLFVTFGLPLYLRRARRNSIAYEALAKQFFEKSDALIENDDTPDRLLSSIEFMTDQINGKAAIRGLMQAIFRPEPPTNDNPESLAELKAFYDRRPEMHEAYSTAIACAMGAIFYNGGGLTGVIARVWLKNMFRKLDAERTVSALQSRYDNRTHPDNMVPA